MTAGLEASRHGLAPVELYEFRQGARAWRYTSGDAPVWHLGVEYSPRAIARGAVRHTGEVGTGTLEVTLPRTDDLVAEFIGYLPPSAIALTVFRLQRQAALGDVAFTGEVASVSHVGAVATLRCVSVETLLARTAPGLAYQSPCNWVLYGAGCGVSAEAHRVDGTAAVVERTTLRVAAAAAHPDGWFTRGWVANATGERRYIAAHAGNLLTLVAPFNALAAGAAVALYPGCAHDETACRTKFDNLVHFLGFPRMPSRNPFTGTV